MDQALQAIEAVQTGVQNLQAFIGVTGKLRDLIRQVRACKTAAEERDAVAKECAAIRNSFSGESAGANRCRNVAKLLFIHMLGFSTQFGQMECLKLIVSPQYGDKRVGYLGLMLLLDENSEVLTLVTNSLQHDLHESNQLVVGLALCALSSIASIGIAQDCAPDVEKLLTHESAYIKKKAALAAVRILRKCPQTAETFAGRIKGLITDRNHAVVLCSVTLMKTMCDVDHHYIEDFRKYVPNMVKILKQLQQIGVSTEHEVNGIADPFLQVMILRLMRVLGKNDPTTSEQMNDILAQVMTNTETTHNVGNAILYEGVQTIMGIASESGLRILAVNILGRFLANKDNNIRYVALNTLHKIVDIDTPLVQRHRNTIVDCLKDPDISIKRRALDLTYALVNESNVRVLVRELLSFLIAADPQFRSDIVSKICWATEQYAPSKRWHFDTILRVLTIAAEFVPEGVVASFLAVISQSPEIQSYAVHRLYAAAIADASQQRPLLQLVALWAMGEFGDLLIQSDSALSPLPGEDEAPTTVQVGPDAALSLVESILNNPLTAPIVHQYGLTCCVKLTLRLPPQFSPRLRTLIEKYQSHITVELQQRSCEYSNLFKFEEVRSTVLDRLPPPPEKELDTKQAAGAKSPQRASPSPASPQPAAPGGDILSLLEGTSPKPAMPSAPVANLLGGIAPVASGGAGAGNLLSELFGGPAVPAAPLQPFALPSGAPLMPNTPIAVPSGSASTFNVFSKNGLTVSFAVTHPPGQMHLYNVTASVTNASPDQITDFALKAAVPKWIKVQMQAASGTAVPANLGGAVTQLIRLVNTSNGQNPVLMKLRLEFRLNGAPTADQTDVSFPAGV
eukprot:TRINITY_DN1857_c0_g2_i1.p1 TRINITY_DN1857_c0_g2~~TRINITY_DN1857_c0_g2_i1.p1  ORF type:complete len:850 (+),score=217.52 TRINITY_DN1857_c0_g2_i1:99-2648(+)